MKKTQSKTDWERVLAYGKATRSRMSRRTAPTIRTMPEATRALFAQADLIRHGKVVRRGKRGPQKAPTKKLVSLRLSPEVIDHFKSTGPGWQTRIDGALMKRSGRGLS